MNDNIFKEGVNARVRGETEINNPYYKPYNMPAQTGETIEAWQEKVESWSFGWKMEDMMRGDS